MSENHIHFMPWDEDALETAVMDNIDWPDVCAGCGRRCSGDLSAKDELTLAQVMVVDHRHWRPICSECFASFGPQPSTASKLFGI